MHPITAYRLSNGHHVLMWSLCLLIGCIIISSSNATITKNITTKDYDNLLAPTLHGDPVVVNISIHVMNVRSVLSEELAFTVDLFVHQYWTDYRLNYPSYAFNRSNLTLHSTWQSKIWVPDLYFKNGIFGEINSKFFRTSYFVLFENKTIFMASRVNVGLSCDLDFSSYPHDTHICSVIFMSLSDHTSTVKLQWNHFDLGSNLSNAEYSIELISYDKCDRTHSIGTFACLFGSLKLTRSSGNFYTKYIPSFTIVTASFTSFWIPVTSYPARASLVVTSLLALITQQIQITSDIKASYLVAINIWANLCTTTVFCCLVEFAFAVIWETRHKGSLERRRKSRVANYLCKYDREDRNAIDEVAKFLIPSLFLCLCFCYYMFVKFSK